MRVLALLSLLLLASCTTPSADNPPDNRNGGTKPPARIQHTPQEADNFIRRFEGLRVGLVNYYNPTKVELVSREFSAETVAFRLNNTGDTGAFHTAAVDLAAELADKYWRHTTAEHEFVVESHLAIVKVQSIGIPAGARAGDHIPVSLKMTGNASDVHGGYVYATPLRNKLGKVVAVLREGYLPFDVAKMSADEVTDEMRADAGNLERRESATGPWFILRKGVQLAADVSADDLSADQIILPLERVVDRVFETDVVVRTLSAEYIPDVLRDIERQMTAQGLPVKAEHSQDKLVITPLGVRETPLSQIYDKVAELRVEIRPKTRMLIVFDDELFRVAFYGAPSLRFMLGDVALTTDPFTRDKPSMEPYQLPFRVSCRVLERASPGRSGKYGATTDAEREQGIINDGHKGRVRLAWSRWKDGRQVEEKTEELDTTDLSELLRHMWVRGAGPREVLAFVIEADSSYAINAELGFNHHKINPDRLGGPR